MRRDREKRSNVKKILFVLSLTFLSLLALYFLSQLLPAAVAFITFKNTAIVTPVVAVNSRKDIEKLLSEKNIDFSEIKESSDGATMIVTLKDDLRAVFSVGHEISWQVSSLQAILQRLTIDNKEALYIDLRFDKPIVKLK